MFGNQLARHPEADLLPPLALKTGRRQVSPQTSLAKLQTAPSRCRNLRQRAKRKSGTGEKRTRRLVRRLERCQGPRERGLAIRESNGVVVAGSISVAPQSETMTNFLSRSPFARVRLNSESEIGPWDCSPDPAVLASIVAIPMRRSATSPVTMWMPTWR